MCVAHEFVKVSRRSTIRFETGRLRRARLVLRPVLCAAVKAAVVVEVAHRVAQHRIHALRAELFNDASDVVLKVRMLRMIGTG